jgi:hypothetical protein
MSTATCRLDTLYMSETSDIQYCADCGLIHLTMGPITLRLSEKHYEEFSRDVNKGLAQLKSQRLNLNTEGKSNVRALRS